MKIIILAAGKGTRLMPLTRNTPKPLIDLGDGHTLLEKQLESIIKSGVIDEVILVVGYLVEQIEAKMHRYRKNGLRIKTVYNPFYDVSNNLVSLWFAKHEMDDDFMITNGDNIFTHDVFTGLTNKTSEGIVLTVDRINKDEIKEGDMKVMLSSNNTVVRVSKQIEKDKTHAESPGLVKVAGEKYIKLYKDVLEELVRNEEYLDKFWLETFNMLHHKGFDVNTFEIDGKTKWQEIDFHFDLDNFRKLISEKKGEFS